MTDADPAEPAAILPPEIAAKYPYARGYLLQRAPETAETVGCGTLLSLDRLEALLERFAGGFPGSDRRAAVSLWTMHYFSILSIGAAIAALEAESAPVLDIQRMSLCVEPGTAMPRAFVLPARPGRGAPGTVVLEALARGHAEPLIETLAGVARVSRKLLWSNLLSYLGWIVDEIVDSGAEGSAPEWARLIRAETWPDGWRNPMHGLIHPDIDASGAPCARRRVCCLRYALPSIGGCGSLCPIPAGRH